MDKRLLTAAVCLFSFAIGCAYLAPLRSRPVWDLPQFYFAGRLVLHGKAGALYDTQAYAGLIQELRQIDERASRQSVYFNRPAFEALLCVPLAFFSFQTVRMLAIFGNLVLLALLLWKMPQWMNAPPETGVWLFVFMPFLYSVAFGQDTLLLTLVYSFSISLLRKGRDLPAGAVLALAACKPHLIWAAPIALAVGKRWKALFAFVGAGAFLALISFAMVGTTGMKQWFALLQAPTTDNTPMLMGNVRAFGLHYGVFAAVSASLAAVVCFLLILRGKRIADQVSAALLVGLLLSPHTYRQDYSLLAIAALASVHPIIRYSILLPWPYFFFNDTLLPFAFLALVWLAAAAAHTMNAGPAASWPVSRCIRPLTQLRRLRTDAYKYLHGAAK